MWIAGGRQIFRAAQNNYGTTPPDEREVVAMDGAAFGQGEPSPDDFK
jgi:hypothetical protein